MTRLPRVFSVASLLVLPLHLTSSQLTDPSIFVSRYISIAGTSDARASAIFGVTAMFEVPNGVGIQFLGNQAVLPPPGFVTTGDGRVILFNPDSTGIPATNTITLTMGPITAIALDGTAMVTSSATSVPVVLKNNNSVSSQAIVSGNYSWALTTLVPDTADAGVTFTVRALDVAFSPTDLISGDDTSFRDMVSFRGSVTLAPGESKTVAISGLLLVDAAEHAILIPEPSTSSLFNVAMLMLYIGRRISSTR
jgi:hypothetical protein